MPGILLRPSSPGEPLELGGAVQQRVALHLSGGLADFGDEPCGVHVSVRSQHCASQVESRPETLPATIAVIPPSDRGLERIARSRD